MIPGTGTLIGLAVLGAAALAIAAGAFGYDYGTKTAEAKHHEQETAAAAVLADLAKRNWDLDQQVLAKTQERVAVQTRTIVKWREKAMALPDRGCGWTADERVLLTKGYCAAFPSAPDCMQAPVPDSASPAGPPDGGGTSAVGVRSDP